MQAKKRCRAHVAMLNIIIETAKYSMIFFTGKLFYLDPISMRMQHADMPSVRQPVNKKAGTRPVSQLLVPAFLKAYLLCEASTNRCLTRCRPSFHVYFHFSS